MRKQEIVENIKSAFIKILEHDKFELTDTTTADDVDGWSSITHMMIINEIETIFSIKFQLMDLMNMQNIGDLILVLEKELNLKA